MLIKQEFNYTPKNQIRMLHIYLPDDYYNSSEQYPVMYFFDGHNLFLNEDATYGTSWGMKEFLDHWSKKIIIVGIECTHIGNERLGEYSPYPLSGSYWGDIPCYGRETMEWIIHEIKPMIDRTYRTWPFREGTAIGGSSMGGLMAIYAGAVYNRWFSKMACVSSAIGFSFEELKDQLQECEMSPDTRFYMSWGGLESGNSENAAESTMARYNNAISDILSEKGAMTYLSCQVDGHHCEADWARQVPVFMEYLWM